MNSDNSLKISSQSPILFFLIVSFLSLHRCACGSDSTDLVSLDPSEVLSKLDLDRPGLEGAHNAAGRGNQEEAFAALLAHYRNLYPRPKQSDDLGDKRFAKADRIVGHVFEWGPYEPADYGEEINWAWDPRGDIEWVAAVYRFHWAIPLANAYDSTRNEDYARAFVELTSDWIEKHPLEKRNVAHPVYEHWVGYPWLDIQTGIRATHLCRAFKSFVHAEAFTPEFLGVLLASLYDHQIKTETFPMNRIHNKAVFEQRGFINIAFTFQEFRESRRWLELALDRTRENLLAQTTSDGVQREWSGGYHKGVMRDALEIMERMESVGIAIPGDYRDRVQKMHDYIFAMTGPNLNLPMFGDASRHVPKTSDRATWPNYAKLVQASQLFDEPKYAARAKLDFDLLPSVTSYAFKEAGMYALRDKWGPEQIYMALHCSPRAISSHDQEDNGTFELSAYGRWLMNDSGYYTYGHDPEGRRWHRRTAAHQTLTLEGENAEVDGKLLLWQTGSEGDVLTVENPSYKGLVHRRTVWFVDHAFFVLLDEAIGDATGALNLHFQFAPGDWVKDAEQATARTLFEDSNVLVRSIPTHSLDLEEEEGWYAWTYGKRIPRPAFRFRHSEQAPASFLTLVVPYKGETPPNATAALSAGFNAGVDRVSLTATVFGKDWEIGRDLDPPEVWFHSTK